MTKNAKISKLSNIAEAIIKTTKDHTMAKKTSKTKTVPLPKAQKGLGGKSAEKQVRLPSIAERKPTEEEAQRLVRMKDSVLMRTLAYALSMRRPHGGIGERNLLGHILLNRPAGTRWTFDVAGNLHIDMRSDKAHRTLFVAHVDTVHRADGANKIRMTESVWYAHGSQLGADDGSGVAMLMHLMHSGVPAHYLFSVGEERGGIGSTDLVKRNPGMFSRFDRAIAFDRKGTTSVISHQGARCCSDTFAEALSLELSGDNLLYMPDDGGVYTDTAEFVDLVPECTNISVGYVREHSDEEAQDILHLQALAENVVKIKWDDLPTARDPLAMDAVAWDNPWGYAAPHDFDFKYYMSTDEVEAYDALKAAAQGGSYRALAVCMAAAIKDEYCGETKDLLRMSENVCARLAKEDMEEALGSVERGECIDFALLDLFSMYY